ncbi:MAG: SulP family inorganic anion transporter, partial [Chromatiaceae bacterium]
MLERPGGYQRGWLRPDLIAGLTTAAVVVPKAMAYATIAGLPVEVGLYTAIVPMVIYAILGTSRPLSVSTTTTLAILTGTQLALVVPNGDPAALLTAATTLAGLVGIMLILAAVLRLGVVASFISDPVLTGFKAGIGLVIVLDQMPKLLGIHFDKGGFLQNLLALIQHLPETSLATLAVGAAMLAILVGLERFVPLAPAPLVAVALGIAASGLFGLQGQGVETLGKIPAGLPAFTAPHLELSTQLWPGALGIALMSFTESIAAARAFAGPGEPRPAPNRELLATGVGNLIGGLFGAMPAGGGTSQTAVNRRAGARTRLAGLVTALAAL